MEHDSCQALCEKRYGGGLIGSDDRGPERAAHRGVEFEDLPIYELALNEVVKMGCGKNLFFSADVHGVIEEKLHRGRPAHLRTFSQ